MARGPATGASHRRGGPFRAGFRGCTELVLYHAAGISRPCRTNQIGPSGRQKCPNGGAEKRAARAVRPGMAPQESGPQARSGSRCRGCRARSRPAKLLATPPSFRSSSLAALADSAAACADAAASAAAAAAMDADADAGGTGVAAVGGAAIADELTCIHCTRPVAPSTHVKGHIISRGTYLIQWQFGDSGECIPFADLDSRHC
jgi:hypothetical protein